MCGELAFALKTSVMFLTSTQKFNNVSSAHFGILSQPGKMMLRRQLFCQQQLFSVAASAAVELTLLRPVLCQI